MLLHEAVKKARKDLKLSQKRLAELAGIQRRQLATLESGGNITLATLRKVLVHLPNLETFTLDAVTATVRRYVPPEEKEKAIASAMGLVLGAVQTLAHAMADGRLPEESEMNQFEEANEILHRGLGYSPEDLEQRRQEAMKNLSPQVPFTKEGAAEGLAAMMNAAREGGIAEQLIEAGILPDDGKGEEDEEGEGRG